MCSANFKMAAKDDVVVQQYMQIADELTFVAETEVSNSAVCIYCSTTATAFAVIFAMLLCNQSVSWSTNVGLSCIVEWLRRCRLELTVEMLKIKQAPAVVLTPPAAADIERGIPVNTDIKPNELNDPLDEAPTIVIIPAVQEDGTSGTEADGLPAPEEAQHSHAPRVVVLKDIESAAHLMATDRV